MPKLRFRNPFKKQPPAPPPPTRYEVVDARLKAALGPHATPPLVGALALAAVVVAFVARKLVRVGAKPSPSKVRAPARRVDLGSWNWSRANRVGSSRLENASVRKISESTRGRGSPESISRHRRGAETRG